MTASISDFDEVLERRRDRELAVRRERVREWQPEIDAEDRVQQQREAARRMIADQRSFASRQQAAAAEIRARREATPAPKAQAQIAKKNEKAQETKKSIALMLAGMSGGIKSMLRVGVASAIATLTGSKDSEGDVAMVAAAAEITKKKREKDEQQLEAAEKKKDAFVRRTMSIDADPSHRRPGLKMTQAPRPALFTGV